MAKKIKYLFLLLTFSVLFLFSATNNIVLANCTNPDDGLEITDGSVYTGTVCDDRMPDGTVCTNKVIEYKCVVGQLVEQSCVSSPTCQTASPGSGGTGGSSSSSTDVFQYGSGLGIYGTPPACYIGSCPLELDSVYPNGEKCVNSFDEFKKNPGTNHYWVEDPRITTQGKADERARQFIYWVINKNSIDDHPVIKQIWNNTRNLSYFLTILVAAIIGIGFIVGQKTNFDTKIKIWPLVWRVLGSLLYITFSFAVVITLIQLADILMKFFTENLGGKDVFNIYFGAQNSEVNYTSFIGCRDLNYRVQDSVNSGLFLLQLKNIVFYLMGSMLIIRKIILWFLLFISPFLAILFSFVLIRNVGWIWIGVFFQWLFYGPLLSLFLGALALIWKTGIPFPFDFSRTGKTIGYVYSTAFNIQYGGPAQILGTLNTVNYVDTYAEYIISILMLLAATFFPWWLLRIFRDYCCDGIMAMKNILMSMYDNMRGTPPTSPTSPLSSTTIGASLNIPRQVEIPVRVKLETIEEIKKTKTEDISRSLNLSATKISDVAHFETNRQVNETVRKNINYLANPTRAETPTERQKFMNIRTELFNRAVKEDRVAHQILIATSVSRGEQLQKRQEIIRSTPQMIPVSNVVSVKYNVSQQKLSSLNSSLTNTITGNSILINSIAQTTQLPIAKIQTILSSFQRYITAPPTQLLENMVNETGLTKEQVTSVFTEVTKILATNKEIVKEIAQKENVKEEEVIRLVSAQIPLIVEPEKHIEQIVTIPPSVAIEDYEQVKKMWKNQYEKGEVPTTENISSRLQWVDQDIIFITNTLNKLLSADEKIKMAGLDDIAYILPVFLINNLKGEELVVYLKAKLEAAKSVEELLTKEKEITEKLKSQANEQFVDISNKKTEEVAKTMEMKQEINIKN